MIPKTHRLIIYTMFDFLFNDALLLVPHNNHSPIHSDHPLLSTFSVAFYALEPGGRQKQYTYLAEY